MESRHSDAMAGGSGAAGSVSDVRHQRHGVFRDIPFICCKNKLGIGISLD